MKLLIKLSCYMMYFAEGFYKNVLKSLPPNLISKGMLCLSYSIHDTNAPLCALQLLLRMVAIKNYVVNARCCGFLQIALLQIAY